MTYYIVVHYEDDDDPRGIPEAGPFDTFAGAKSAMASGPYNNLGDAEVVESEQLIAQYPGGEKQLHDLIALAQVSRSEDMPKLNS